MKLPIMPLNSHVLPEGALALRIFEPRYVRMVKEACASDGFIGMAMLREDGEVVLNTHIHPIVTACKIVDFELLADGFLGVSLVGCFCCQIAHIETESDGLRRAQADQISLWPQSENASDIQDAQHLATSLQGIFEHVSELNAHYREKHMDSTRWIAGRLIELLPIEASDKQSLLQAPSLREPLEFLARLIAK